MPRATLIQKQAFYTLNRGTSKILPIPLVSTTGQTVGPNVSDVYCELMLTIPEDAPPSIDDCPILEVQYIVTVRLVLTKQGTLISQYVLECCWSNSVSCVT